MKKHINPDHRLTAAIEALEPRRMLTVDTFNATAGNDLIEISDTGSLTRIVINGTIHNSAASDITINAGAGNDHFRVFSTRPSVIIRAFGQEGNDICENPTRDLDAVYRGPLFFFGGPGTDTYFADNLDDSTAPTTIDISRTSIFKVGHGAISLFDQIEVLDYRDSNGSNRISFTNIQSATEEIMTVRINGSGGNDIITNIHSTSSFGPWSTAIGTGGLFVDGGTGNDTLLLNNHGGGSGVHTLTSNSITVTAAGSDAGPLTYANIETIDFDVTSLTGTGNDVIHLQSKPVATSLSFDSGPGDDQFIVGGGDLDSNGWHLVTLVGGSGADSIIFNDELDTSDDGTSSTYTLASQSLTKGTQVINYSGFESQTLKSANGVGSGFNTVPVVNVNATASIMQSTTITGGAARGCTVNVGNGSFANLFGTFNLVLNGGLFDRLTASDATAGGIANGYQVTDAFVRKSATNQTINYSGVSQMTLSTSTVFDSVAIDSTPAGMSLSVLTNGGNDLINFGGNIGANIRGPVSINGGAGTDSLTITNVLDNTPSTQTLTSTSFTDGFTHTYSGFETLTINEGPGGSDLAVNSIGIPTTINGGSGDDHFTVGGGDIDANIPISTSAAPALIINGGGGLDSIRFDDFNGPNVDSYIFQRTNGIDQLVKRDGANDYVVKWVGIDGVTLDASNAPATFLNPSRITVTETFTPLRINGNGGSDDVQITHATAPVIVHTGLGDADHLTMNANAGTVVIEQSDDVEQLIIGNGSTVRVGTGATLVKTRNEPLTGFLTVTGVLDLAGGAFLSRAGGPITLDGFRDRIIAGRNAGAWNGTSASGAINSSLAASSPESDGVGYGLGSQIAISSIGGFTIAAGDTLLRYTLDGDADLNQIVNLSDFNRLAANFGQSNRAWVDGDSNYDGLVNLADFNALATNFGQAVAATNVFGQERIHGDSDSADRSEILEELS